MNTNKKIPPRTLPKQAFSDSSTGGCQLKHPQGERGLFPPSDTAIGFGLIPSVRLLAKGVALILNADI